MWSFESRPSLFEQEYTLASVRLRNNTQPQSDLAPYFRFLFGKKKSKVAGANRKR